AGGGMLAIAASADEVRPLLGTELSLAAVNSAGSVVVSGPVAALDELAETVTGRGLRTKRLRVSHAFHSALMEPMLEEFAALARTLDYHEPLIPIVSSLTGQLAEGELATADYWVRHVRETVLFHDAVATLRGL